jgi:hypothetical protein
MSLRRRTFALAIAVALAGAGGCRLGPQGPSAVAQGHYFSTGNPNYDEFFVRLYRMQVELKTAPEALAASRAELLRELALEPNAEGDAVRKALSAKASELGARGVSLAFDRGRDAGEPRLVVSGTPQAADRPLVKTLEDSVARLGEVRRRSSTWQKELDWLSPAGVALDGGVEGAFVGKSRSMRSDVHENLVDAQKVVALMSSRNRDVSESAAEFEGLLASALGAVRTEAPAAPPEEPKPKPRPRANAGGAARGASAAPADETPAPAAKPKQGTARPDFEP